ncbi:MAG TPA: hydroxyacid dehydrogenase [Anaerolineales bacterium]|nr:hydroxyacid dehydrogenase [Anaerolineales bacterium]
MKVIVCDKTEESAINKMRNGGLDVDVKDTITLDELMQVLPSYDAMVVRSRTKVPKELLEKSPNLKLIVRGGVGLDTIDVEAAKKLGILVKNTPLASTNSVAELTIGLMFALARHIVQAANSVKGGKWEKKAFDGIELSGKTLGLIGFGNIGKAVATRATALGMKVIAYDPYIKETMGYEVIQDLKELLSRADFLSLHMPRTAETTKMIGKNEFEIMKDGVRIVNCGRGGIVDEQALYEALVSGKVASAALDVFENEPLTDLTLVQLPNVICSPHIGASTKEGQGRVGAEVADILIEFAKSN